MAKFRKKPVVVEAFKWTGGPDQAEDPVWIIEAIKAGAVRFAAGKPLRMMIVAMGGGVVIASIGDYIIRGVEGEIYPCKASVFETTYEAVDE